MSTNKETQSCHFFWYWYLYARCLLLSCFESAFLIHSFYPQCSGMRCSFSVASGCIFNISNLGLLCCTWFCSLCSFSLIFFYSNLNKAPLTLSLQLQCGVGRHTLNEALLQRFLHWCPQATGQNCRFHLWPLPGDKWQAWEEHRRRVEWDGWGGEAFIS